MPDTTTLPPVIPPSGARSVPSDHIADATGLSAGSTEAAVASTGAVAPLPGTVSDLPGAAPYPVGTAAGSIEPAVPSTRTAADSAGAAATSTDATTSIRATDAPTGTGTTSPGTDSNNSTSGIVNPSGTEATSAPKPAAGTIDDPITPPSCDEASLDLTITDSYGHPIADLAFKVMVLKKEVFKGKSNAKGTIPTIQNLRRGCHFEIWIKKDKDTPDGKRDDAEGYKYAATGTAHSDETYACLKSPRTRFEFATEAHLGVSGQATKRKEAVIQSHNQKPADAPQITGSLAKKPEIKAGRDDKGLPKAAVVDGQKDWYGRNAKNAGTPPASASDLDHVKRLIEFAEMQATWEYVKTTTSATYIQQMISATFKIPAKKGKDGFANSVRQCNKYVKIALWKAGYGPATEEIGVGESPARKMGPHLVAAGFKDITSEIPDGRWAAPGDVIVYEKKSDPTDSGHIDIRTYNGYISDFFATYLPGKFTVTGIYRKYHDPLPVKRMLAFLKIFREWECHEEDDDSKRYFLMMNPINGSRRFTNVTTHPFEGTGLKGATPAGGYQINLITYNDFIGDRFGIGKGFSPVMQDRLAVAIMEATIKRDDQYSALARVREGNIEEAVKMLAGRWSSLPTGSQKRIGKPGNPKYVFTFEDLIRAYEKNLSEL